MMRAESLLNGAHFFSTSRHGLIGCFLQCQFYLLVTTSGGVPILPGACRRRKIAVFSGFVWVGDSFSIVGRHQMGEVRIVNVPPMQFFRGWSLESVRRGLVDK